MPGSGTTAYLPLTAPSSIAWWLKSPPIAMPAFPAANAVTVSLPPICAHLAAGQLSGPKRSVYAAIPACDFLSASVEVYAPSFSSARPPPCAQRKGMAP